MNDIFAPLFEWFFNYDDSATLLDALNDGKEYTKIALAIMAISLFTVILFYKLLDPVRNQRAKWFSMLIINLIVGPIIVSFLIKENIDVMKYIGNYDAESLEISWGSFIFQLSILVAFYFGALTTLLSIGGKYLSKTNKFNPF